MPQSGGLAPEPIAVVGMSCRLPKAPDLPSFWRLLHDGASGITEVPEDRRGTAGDSTRWGGFIDHVDLFDPAFFNISPRQAAAMDPQRRLMLELSWEALEDAGIIPAGLEGRPAGVFVGAGSSAASSATGSRTPLACRARA
jgi:acyl transferase domain-containing protein